MKCKCKIYFCQQTRNDLSNEIKNYGQNICFIYLNCTKVETTSISVYLIKCYKNYRQ